MFLPIQKVPGAISFCQIKNSSNAILKLIRQIYFPSIFPTMRYNIYNIMW